MREQKTVYRGWENNYHIREGKKTICIKDEGMVEKIGEAKDHIKKVSKQNLEKKYSLGSAL